MTYYALLYYVVDDYTSRRASYRDEHLRRAREAHRRGDLAGGADRQRANVLILGRKCEGPSLPEHGELQPSLLGAAGSLDLICRGHRPPRFVLRLSHKTGTVRC